MPSGQQMEPAVGGWQRVAAMAALSAFLVCGQTPCRTARAAEEPPHPAALDDAIVAAAKRHGVPERLVRRVIMRESKYNPHARNHKFWGLMQISYPTAKSMGFTGTPQQLLDPVVNLRYAVPYLANAFVIAGKDEAAAVRLYAAGYYNTARSRGLLSALRTADSVPLSGVVQEQPLLAANAVAQPPESVGIFGALFGPGSQLQPQPQAQPQPQQIATATAPEAERIPAPASAAAPPGTFDGRQAEMVAGKDGRATPPKKWTRDGGLTAIARGEQPLEQLASREKGGAPASAKSRRHARKFTAYAALDLPASSAQAYASQQAQDPRFIAAASQAAIAQATADQTAPARQSVSPAATQEGIAGQQTQARAVSQPTIDTNVSDDKPTKRKRSRHARKRKPSDKETQEARATKDSSAVAAPSSPPVVTR